MPGEPQPVGGVFAWELREAMESLTMLTDDGVLSNDVLSPLVKITSVQDI